MSHQARLRQFSRWYRAHLLIAWNPTKGIKRHVPLSWIWFVLWKIAGLKWVRGITMEYRLVFVALLALTIGQVHGTKEIHWDERWGFFWQTSFYHHPKTHLSPFTSCHKKRNVQRASMNEYMDYVLTYMAPIFRSSGLIPMDLPDTSIGWEAVSFGKLREKSHTVTN